MMQNCSLTLGHDKITPRHFARTHAAADIGSYAGVAITEQFTVSGHDVEVLLAISTAFADAALALGRLQDQEKAALA